MIGELFIQAIDNQGVPNSVDGRGRKSSPIRASRISPSTPPPTFPKPLCRAMNVFISTSSPTSCLAIRSVFPKHCARNSCTPTAVRRHSKQVLTGIAPWLKTLSTMRHRGALPRLCSMYAATRTSGRSSPMSRDCARLAQRTLNAKSCRTAANCSRSRRRKFSSNS